MRKYLRFLFPLFIVFLLTACSCEHDWTNATCTSPVTCLDCGEAAGEPLSHTWQDATCTNPKICILCYITEGNAIGHNWGKATCVSPKTCYLCNAEEGFAIGHDWENATCTTPKTCLTCSQTEGQSLGHLWQPATYDAPKTCLRCEKTEGTAAVRKCLMCDNSVSKSGTPYCSVHDCARTNCPNLAKSNGRGGWGSYCETHGCHVPGCTNTPEGNYCATHRQYNYNQTLTQQNGLRPFCLLSTISCLVVYGQSKHKTSKSTPYFRCAFSVIDTLSPQEQILRFDC